MIYFHQKLVLMLMVRLLFNAKAFYTFSSFSVGSGVSSSTVVGSDVGFCIGSRVGLFDGSGVGSSVVGFSVGFLVGSGVGLFDGEGVGFSVVGLFVGEGVGSSVIGSAVG